MTFLGNHASKEDPLARVLLSSVVLHYAIFFILVGNPFLLRFDDSPEKYGVQKHFDVQLLALPGLGGQAFPSQQALALFPPEVESANGGKKGEGLNPEAFFDKPSQINEAPKASDMAAFNIDPPVNAVGQGDVLRIGSMQHEGKPPLIEKPLPLVTSKKPPLNMTGPADCMIKVVGMVCPNGDAKCITEYKAFCATLPK